MSSACYLGKAWYRVKRNGKTDIRDATEKVCQKYALNVTRVQIDFIGQKGFGEKAARLQ